MPSGVGSSWSLSGSLNKACSARTGSRADSVRARRPEAVWKPSHTCQPIYDERIDAGRMHDRISHVNKVSGAACCLCHSCGCGKRESLRELFHVSAHRSTSDKPGPSGSLPSRLILGPQLAPAGLVDNQLRAVSSAVAFVMWDLSHNSNRADWLLGDIYSCAVL